MRDLSTIMRIYLAPMEGVVDAHFRDLITRLGGIDICVTEFIRVTEQKLPKRVFRRYCPELEHQSLTASKTPVRVQLLGSNSEMLAINAQTAVSMGACAIDLNFGCPAKTVNRHRGGACLLQEPDLIHQIVSSVRKAVDPMVPVTAKIRLGFNDRSRYMDNALAIEAAGANEIAVHARSKVDGYKPPAYWEYVGEIKQALSIPVIPNGEVWSVEDYHRCREVTGCDDIMIGRGLISCPDLGLQIKANLNNQDYTPMNWVQVSELLIEFIAGTEPEKERYVISRLKQWLVYLRRQYPEASACFEAIKRITQLADIRPILGDFT